MLRPSAMHQGEPRKAANSGHGVVSEDAHTGEGDASMRFALRQAPVWRAAWGRRLTHCGHDPGGEVASSACSAQTHRTHKHRHAAAPMRLGIQSVGGRAD